MRGFLEISVQGKFGSVTMVVIRWDLSVILDSKRNKQVINKRTKKSEK